MTYNRFLIKLSSDKSGLNLDRITNWTMAKNGSLFITFDSGEDTINALSIDLESFDLNQTAAKELREKAIISQRSNHDNH
jgi:ribosomal protein S4E